jgi:hypothetical protein
MGWISCRCWHGEWLPLRIVHIGLLGSQKSFAKGAYVARHRLDRRLVLEEQGVVDADPGGEGGQVLPEEQSEDAGADVHRLLESKGAGPGGQGLPGPFRSLHLLVFQDNNKDDSKDDNEDSSEDRYKILEKDSEEGDDDHDGSSKDVPLRKDIPLDVPLRKDIPLGLTIFSDREKGIAMALNIHFPDCAYVVFCMKHIKSNIAVKFGLTKPV